LTPEVSASIVKHIAADHDFDHRRIREKLAEQSGVRMSGQNSIASGAKNSSSASTRSRRKG